MASEATAGVRRNRRTADAILGTVVLLVLWRLASQAIGMELILPHPERVARVLARLAGSAEFWGAVGSTALRGLTAFGLSLVIGGTLGILTGASDRLDSALSPLLTVIRATPVMAIILLAWIWFSSGQVPVFSAVVMAFPVVAADVAAGVRSADPKLIEMATLFGLSRQRITFGIRLPSALPHVAAGARNALGLAWKVVIAGEVLSQPVLAIGTGMYMAKSWLETAEVFAWAAAGVALCALGDALFSLAVRRLSWPTA